MPDARQYASSCFASVITGLDPVIQERQGTVPVALDCRVKPGNDDRFLGMSVEAMLGGIMRNGTHA